MKTIISGGRNFVPEARHTEWLDRLRTTLPITEVVSGCARGADQYGEYWAQGWDLPIVRFPADWKTHGKAAGPIRNREMVAVGQALVAFPGGSGTADMIRQAERAGIPVFRFEP